MKACHLSYICFVILVFLNCSKETNLSTQIPKPEENNDTVTVDFRSGLEGEYIGVYHYRYKSVTNNNGNWNMEETDTVYDAIFSLIKDGDSAVFIDFDKPNSTNNFKINLTSTNAASYSGGTGSSYWTKSIKFHNDSIRYYSFSKCGMPCERSVLIQAKRQE